MALSFKGMHPKFNRVGSVADNPNLGPASYNVEKLRKHLPNIDFKRKLETEEFSRNLGYARPQILKEKNDTRRALGPGWHDVLNPTYIHRKCTHNKLTGRDFTTQKRFTEDRTSIPPPGMYIRKHKEMILHQFTPIGSFDWATSERGLKDAPSWSLAPNRYMCMKDYKSIVEFVKKRITARGPYDLFTGPRDETTIKNHFGPPLYRGCVNWPYALPSGLDLLLNDMYKGKMSETPKEILIPDEDKGPGPTDYDPIMTWEYKPINRKQCGFLSCKYPARPKVQYKVHPGPGRYTLKPIRNEAGAVSAFKTKVPRLCDRKPISYKLF